MVLIPVILPIFYAIFFFIETSSERGNPKKTESRIILLSSHLSY